jgi:polyferredoxin
MHSIYKLVTVIVYSAWVCIVCIGCIDAYRCTDTKIGKMREFVSIASCTVGTMRIDTSMHPNLVRFLVDNSMVVELFLGD